VLYLEERSTREMAEVLGIGESNVTTKIGRLKQRIRDYAAPTKPTDRAIA
jgi:RNA polymerase sigma-70 factor (ECF subfamily)